MVTTQEKVRLDQDRRPEANRPAGVKPAAPAMSPSRPVRGLIEGDEEEDKRSFFQRYRFALVGLAIAWVLVILAIRIIARAAGPPPKQTSLVLVSLPPPPPPPPVQTPPPETVRDEQTFQPEEKPEEEPPKPPDQPPIGTNIKGDGSSNAFNLGNSKGTGFGDQSTKSTRFGWYAGQVQSRISEALRNNSKTRAAELSIQARIWPDATGRIIRVRLSGSTGDAALDAALRDEVLTGLQLREPPPPGMPLPIVLRVSEKRPR